MKKQIGMWIDRKQAFIVTLEDGKEDVQHILSNMEQRVRFRGGARAKTAYSPQFFTGETQVERRYQKHLNEYYKEVISAVSDAKTLLVLGAGEAKFEFEKLLRQESNEIEKIRVESADRMTEPQIAARVRRYFGHQP